MINGCRTGHIIAPGCGERPPQKQGRIRNTFAENNSSRRKTVCDVLATSDFSSKATNSPSPLRRGHLRRASHQDIDDGTCPIWTNTKAKGSRRVEIWNMAAQQHLRMWNMNFRGEVARVSYRLTHAVQQPDKELWEISCFRAARNM